jgi:CTP synthase
MEDQKNITNMGGSMRLGSWDCEIKKNSKVHSIYNAKLIKERHRHRWELNNTYLEELEKAGLKASGINSSTGLVEIVELPENDWFIGVQFHPEYKSTVENPHPLFVSFISACLNYNKSKK